MATEVATDSDTLCTIASAHGFLNCQPLRDDPANSAFLTRRLQNGDVVTVPSVTERTESGGTDKKHKFRLKTAPPVSIRFVHGSPATHYLEDDSLTVLNVSNFVTDKAGSNGQQPFPSLFEFQQAGHDDPDTFKVEVVDPLAGATINVLLEAIRPTYAINPAGGSFLITSRDVFQGAAHADRSTALDCAKVHSGVAYRSRYLRLVTDERGGVPNPADHQRVPHQTLLVSDLADGAGSGQPGDNDTLEVLDQEVRASYTIQRCPAADPNRCTVRAQLPIGGEERRRLRVSFHVYRTSVGGPAVSGVTAQAVRFRTFKWLRRVFAQANISPKLMGIEFLDPPPPNMLVIAPDTGVMPSGQTAGGADSFLSLTLAPSPDAPAQTFSSVSVRVNLGQVVRNAVAGRPKDIGDALVAAMPAGFTAQAFENPSAFNAAVGSCDVLITRADATRVAISGETHDDGNGAFRIFVPRVFGAIHPLAPSLGPVLRLLENGPTGTVLICTGDQRLFIRNTPGADNVMDVYVIDFLENAAGRPAARGSTCLRGREVRAGFEARSPMRDCCFLGRSPGSDAANLATSHPALDMTDFDFFTLPHETGHVLGDFGHPASSRSFHDNTDLMGISGPRVINAVNACKRIPDTPISVSMTAFDPLQPTPGALTSRSFVIAQRMRTEGAGLLENW